MDLLNQSLAEKYAITSHLLSLQFTEGGYTLPPCLWFVACQSTRMTTIETSTVTGAGRMHHLPVIESRPRKFATDCVAILKRAREPAQNSRAIFESSCNRSRKNNLDNTARNNFNMQSLMIKELQNSMCVSMKKNMT